MTLWLQSVLAIGLILLCIFLILLLRQLQRTAASIQNLAESAQNDLQQIAADIHNLKNHIDKSLDLATDNLGLSLTAKSLMSKTIQTMSTLLSSKNLTWLEIIFTNIKLVSKLVCKISKK